MRDDSQSAPTIQFAGDATLVVNTRGQTLMLSLEEALALLDWLNANEDEILMRLQKRSGE